MLDFVFAIPSHARSEDQKTLEYLHKLNIPASKIYMCVWDSELHDYAQWQPYVNSIFTTSIHNLPAGRNVLLDKIPSKYIVMLDDDISKIGFLKKGKKLGIEPVQSGKQLSDFIELGFKISLAKGARLWGIYLGDNALFMSHRIKEKAFIEGTFLGIVNDGMRFNTAYSVNEDMDFCCRSYKKYGLVLRFDFVSITAKHKSKGGCDEFWYLQPLSYKLLMKEHSDLLKPNPKQKYGLMFK
jgi:hypothetical protein